MWQTHTGGTLRWGPQRREEGLIVGRRPAPNCGFGGPCPCPQLGRRPAHAPSLWRQRPGPGISGGHGSLWGSGADPDGSPGGQGRCPLAPGWAASEAKAGSQGLQGRGAWSSASADRRHSQGAPTAQSERSRGRQVADQPLHMAQKQPRRGEVQNSGLGQPRDRHRNPSEAAQVRRRWGAPGQAQSPREQPGVPGTPPGAFPPKEPWGQQGHQVPPGGFQQGRPVYRPQGHQRHEPLAAAWRGPAGDTPLTG